MTDDPTTAPAPPDRLDAIIAHARSGKSGRAKFTGATYEATPRLNKDGMPAKKAGRGRFESPFDREQKKRIEMDILAHRSTTEICQQYQISKATLYRWKSQLADDMRAMKRVGRASRIQNLAEEVGEIYDVAKDGMHEAKGKGDHKTAIAYMGAAANLLRLEAERSGEIGAKAAPAPQTQILQLFGMPKAPGVPLMMERQAVGQIEAPQEQRDENVIEMEEEDDLDSN